MSTKALYYRDDRQISEDEALDENGLIKDGVSVRVPTFMRDSTGHMLVDALGQPITTNHHGYAFADTDAKRRVEDRAYQKAELSSRWKGGLAEGDTVTIGDQRLEVTGRNPESNKLVLSDTAQLDADDEKRAAYNDGVADMCDAWRTRPPTLDAEPGDACTTQRGERGQWFRTNNGKLVCKPVNSDKSRDREFEIAGPLSDAVEVQKARDTAYAELVEELQNAWRR